MLELFSHMQLGEIRTFHGCTQSYIANVASVWCRRHKLNWRIKTWHQNGDTYAMRIDDLPDDEVKAKIDAFPGPNPERGIGRPCDRMVINRDKLHEGAVNIGYKQPARDTSKYRWAQMEVGDTRIVPMNRGDVHFFLSRWLIGHPDINWEFVCERQRHFETSNRQSWLVRRTR